MKRSRGIAALVLSTVSIAGFGLGAGRGNGSLTTTAQAGDLRPVGDGRGTAPSASGGTSGSASAGLFDCPLEHRVFGEAPPIPDLQRQQSIIRRAGEITWDGFELRWTEPTHLGVVALIAGDLEVARNRLQGFGVAHVYRWDASARSVGVDAHGQVIQVLQWLLEPAVYDLRRAYRGIAGYESLALWQEAGAVLLQWKAPVPAEITALAGVRPDGVEVIVEPTRFSASELQAAGAKAVEAIRSGRVKADWSMSHACADGSGVVVGVAPKSMGDRRAELQEQLSGVANMPVYVVPEEPPVPAIG